MELSLPQMRLRKLATGAQPPAPGSAIGGTGTPKHSIRCPNDLWGAALNRLHARDLELSSVVRGYLAAIVTGEAILYDDPTAPRYDGDDGEPVDTP